MPIQLFALVFLGLLVSPFLGFAQTKPIPIDVKVRTNVNGLKSDTTIRAVASITVFSDSLTAAITSDTTYLRNLAGSYTYWDGNRRGTALVMLGIDKILSIRIDNQGEYDMVPIIPILFDVKGLEDVKVLYFLDKQNQVQAMNIIYKKERKQLNLYKQ